MLGDYALDNTTKSFFLGRMKPIAIAIAESHGIHPLITFSQAALESGWGTSLLAEESNNLYGMTAGSWLEKKLPIKDYPTKEDDGSGELRSTHRYFRVYDSWLKSAQNWADNLKNLSIYATAYAAAKGGDLNFYAPAIAKAGYATDTKYAAKLLAAGAAVTAALASEEPEPEPELGQGA